MEPWPWIPICWGRGHLKSLKFGSIRKIWREGVKPLTILEERPRKMQKARGLYVNEQNAGAMTKPAEEPD